MCSSCDLAKMKLELKALLAAQHELRTNYVRESVEMLNRAATLKAQIMAEEGERRKLRVVK